MLRYVGIIIAKIIGRIFYEAKYLKGKYFEENQMGWRFILNCFFEQKILGKNRLAGFPVNGTSKISNPKRIHFDVDDLNNFQSPGCYFQNFDADIYIGKGSYIAPNVGLITANHDLNDLSQHYPGSDIILGKKCWVGMNTVILPGVNLGDNTIVAAGAVVTKSFPDGNCVIGGVPAKVLKVL